MRLLDFTQKDLIASQSGRNLGRIVDLDISFNLEKGGVELLVFSSRKGLFGKREVRVRWEQVRIIGEDVVILDI